MMFLLDTNVVSELRKSGFGKAHPNVLEWANSVDAARLFISAITLMELEMGVLLAERKDPAKGALLRKWLNDRVILGFKGRILPFTEQAALRCARLHVPDKKSEKDALIGATALAHHMTLVTRNIADFVAMSVPLINPWDGPHSPPE